MDESSLLAELITGIVGFLVLTIQGLIVWIVKRLERSDDRQYELLGKLDQRLSKLEGEHNAYTKKRHPNGS